MKEIKNIKKIQGIKKIFSDTELDILRDAGIKVFAKKSGVSESYVYDIREGKRDIKSPKAQKVIMVLVFYLKFYLTNIDKINKDII
jgi:transcriptional regulator with XRE-family HTH domain